MLVFLHESVDRTSYGQFDALARGVTKKRKGCEIDQLCKLHFGLPAIFVMLETEPASVNSVRSQTPILLEI